MSAHPRQSATLKTVVIMLAAALVAAVAIHAHDSYAHPAGGAPVNQVLVFFSEFVRELAIGTVVGCVVALLFEVSHWKSVIGEPLENIKAELKSTHTESTAATATLIAQNQILKSTAEHGLTAFHSRGPEMERAVREIVNNSKTVIFISGRAHAKMLGDGEQLMPSWLTQTLLDRMEVDASIRVHLLLGDAYSERSEFRSKTLLRENHDRFRQGRSTVEVFIAAIAKRDRERWDRHEAGLLRRIEIRFNASDIPYAMVMSGGRALIEHYLPNAAGGKTPIFELRKMPRSVDSLRLGSVDSLRLGSGDSGYSHLAQDFEKQFEMSEKALPVLERFLQRKGLLSTGGPISNATPVSTTAPAHDCESTRKCYEILKKLKH